jgi:HAE1 family hydrophobic/amphiphilic exporter-1
MQAYGLSIPQVQQNILSSNLDFPTETFKLGTKILIRLAGKYKMLKKLRNLIVSSRGIKFVWDVADVQDTQLRRKCSCEPEVPLF